MVSISWYLSENVRVEMSKTQHFEKFEKVICSELAAKVYIYVCIYTDMGTGRKRRENEDHSWTMESPPTRYRAGRGSTAGMATDMIGPRWKRRPFVDEGIPPDRVPFRSRFHRWNGFRHDRATMETKIIRGRWDSCRPGTSRHNNTKRNTQNRKKNTEKSLKTPKNFLRASPSIN